MLLLLLLLLYWSHFVNVCFVRACMCHENSNEMDWFLSVRVILCSPKLTKHPKIFVAAVISCYWSGQKAYDLANTKYHHERRWRRWRQQTNWQENLWMSSIVFGENSLMNRFTTQSSAQNFSFFIFGLCFDVFVYAIWYSLTLLSLDSVDRQTPKNYHTPNQSQEKRNDCRRTKRIHTDNSMMVGSCWNNFNWIFSTYLFNFHSNFANLPWLFRSQMRNHKKKMIFFFLTHSEEDCSRFNMKFSFDCWFRTTVDLYYSIQRFTMCFYFFFPFLFDIRFTHRYAHTHTCPMFAHSMTSYVYVCICFCFDRVVIVCAFIWILMLYMVH